MLGYRNNDAVLVICQNNKAKSIEIVSLNDVATGLLGYSTADLQGKAFTKLVPERMSILLEEYVEYEADANDVGAVLSKVQSLTLIAKDKKEKRLRLKVVRDESLKDKITFRLVLQDTIDLRKDDAIQKLIQENFKGHEVLDKTFGVPDLASLKKDIDLVAYYHHKAQLRASLLMIQIDYYESFESQYGELQCIGFIKHIMQVCRGSLRPGDVVAYPGNHHIGILLLDSASDATRMVANRLRWQIAANPFKLVDKTTLPLSASMVYANVTGAVNADKILTACEAELMKCDGGASAHLLEVTV